MQKRHVQAFAPVDATSAATPKTIFATFLVCLPIVAACSSLRQTRNDATSMKWSSSWNTTMQLQRQDRATPAASCRRAQNANVTIMLPRIACEHRARWVEERYCKRGRNHKTRERRFSRRPNMPQIFRASMKRFFLLQQTCRRGSFFRSMCSLFMRLFCSSWLRYSDSASAISSGIRKHTKIKMLIISIIFCSSYAAFVCNICLIMMINKREI